MSWWTRKVKRNSYAQLRARDQARRLGYQVIFAEALLEIAEDGELTKEDLGPAARGAAAATLLYYEETVLEILKRRGVFVAASSLLNWLTAFYLAGLSASYLIDGKTGAANFNRFMGHVITNPLNPSQASTDIQITGFNIAWATATIFFNDAKSGQQKQAEERVQKRSQKEAGIFKDDQLNFGIFDSFIRALA